MNKPIEELIQRLKEPDYKYYGCELSRGEAELVISALEKQIPKKPDLEADGYVDGYLAYDIWICPCCETRYEVDYDDYKNCPKCGQAIDWRNDDE